MLLRISRGVNIMSGLGRKAPCPCGSGKRYKHCCGQGVEHHLIAARAQAVFAQGHRAHLAGRLDEARRAYEAVLALDPDHAAALHYLGMVLLAAGQVPQARALVQRSLQCKGHVADFWANAAEIERRMGNLPGALAAYQRAVALEPGEAGRQTQLASLLLQAGEVGEATRVLQTATQLAPGHAHAWLLLGHAWLKATPAAPEAAIAALRQAARLAPQQADICIALGTALALAQESDAARAAFEQAVRYAPDNAEARRNLATFHLHANEAAAAIEHYRQALVLCPDAPHAWLDLARALAARGDFVTACSHYAEVIRRWPEHLEAWARWVEHGEAADWPHDRLAEVQALADRKGPDSEGWVDLQFALGKRRDRLGDYTGAFQNFARGNQYLARTARFDGAAWAQQVDRLIGHYSAGAITALATAGNPDERPVFIVGMPRSGTSLVEQILASHDAVCGGGEREFWPRREARCLDPEARPVATVLHAQTRDYLRELTALAREGPRRITDKMPDNFKRLGLLHAALPQSRIVHVRRHPVDTCLSIFFQNFKGHDYARSLEDLVAYYRQYQRLMAHWRQVLPSAQFLELEYESLVADQAGETRRLLAFCGLPWSPACLDFQHTDRVVQTASLWQVRQTLHDRSVARWRHYEAQLGPLRALLDAPETADEGQ
jgi:tetratricopeptide (TPR) repeat protein